MLTASDPSIPHSDARLHAAWGLVLPYARHVLVIAEEVPATLLAWWKRHGVCVSVVRPGEAVPVVSPTTTDQLPDLILFWDVDRNSLRQQLRGLDPERNAEVAVWRVRVGSLGALQLLLEVPGFRHRGWSRTARVYAWPDVQKPRQLIEHDQWTRTPLHVHRRSRSRWKVLMLQSSVGRGLAPASLTRWRQEGSTPAPSWLQSIVLQASSRVGEALVATDTRLSPNGTAIVLVQKRQDASPAGVLKIPLTASTLDRVATNAKALDWMRQMRASFGNWSDVSPRLLAAESTHGCDWTLEEHVTGSEAQTWESAPARQATQHLAELLGHYKRAASTSIDIGQLQERLQPQVENVSALLEADLAQALQTIWRNTVRNLENVRIPILPQHGDCKLENVLGDPRQPTQLRLLDWELWRPDGLPLLDLLHLLLSRRRRQGGYSIGGSICRWLLSDDFSPWERRLVDTLAQGLDRQYVRETPVLYWLERIGPVASRGAWPHDGWAQANVVQVIERMKKRQAEVLA